MEAHQGVLSPLRVRGSDAKEDPGRENEAGKGGGGRRRGNDEERENWPDG